MERRAGARLAGAIALSALLHLSLIYGVQIGSDRPVPMSRIDARLSPAESPHQPVRVAAGAHPNGSPSRPRVAPGEPVRARPAVDASVSDDAVLAARQPEEHKSRPRLNVPAIIDPVWYEARDLDLFPRPLSPVAPQYPGAAGEPGMSGELTLALRIDEYGTVQDARVVKAEPPGYFDAAALSAFRSAQFTPAQRDGHAVRSLIAVRVRMGPPRTPGPEQEAAQ